MCWSFTRAFPLIWSVCQVLKCHFQPVDIGLRRYYNHILRNSALNTTNYNIGLKIIVGIANILYYINVPVLN